jgi:ATP-dependent RNA helicase DeaD
VAYVVARAHKPAALGRVLDMEDPASALVFCRTRLEVETLVETLNAHGYRAEALHGGLVQRQRDRVMGRFRSGEVDLLVATDVAARGLDIEHLSHVVNYDVPATAEAYVHRIGRTGRVGRAGVAITLAEPREHRLLRSIEAYTKQRIEVAAVPTVADLRARRLDVLRASLREQLLAGSLDDVRVIVESLAEEFDIVDVAAAAVKLAHAASGDAREEPEIPSAAPPREPAYRRNEGPAGRDRGDRGEAGRPRPGRPVSAGTVRIHVSAGRQAGIRPGDLVGAITGEAGIGARSIGAIEIADRFSLVEVPGELADAIIEALRKSRIKGKKVPVRREDEGAGRGR